MQTIGQLDQQYAQITDHGQDHLAKTLGCGFLAGTELDLIQLGDTIHQKGDGGVEFVVQLRMADRGIFNGVVQDGGANTFMVQPQLGQQQRYRDRMLYVGFATFAELTFMGGCADSNGLVDQLDLFCREILLQAGAQVTQYFGIATGALLAGDFSGRRPRHPGFARVHVLLPRGQHQAATASR